MTFLEEKDPLQLRHLVPFVYDTLLVPFCIPVVWQGLVTAGYYTCTGLLHV